MPDATKIEESAANIALRELFTEMVEASSKQLPTIVPRTFCLRLSIPPTGQIWICSVCDRTTQDASSSHAKENVSDTLALFSSLLLPRPHWIVPRHKHATRSDESPCILLTVTSSSEISEDALQSIKAASTCSVSIQRND